MRLCSKKKNVSGLSCRTQNINCFFAVTHWFAFLVSSLPFMSLSAYSNYTLKHLGHQKPLKQWDSTSHLIQEQVCSQDRPQGSFFLNLLFRQGVSGTLHTSWVKAEMREVSVVFTTFNVVSQSFLKYRNFLLLGITIIVQVGL